MLTDIKRMSGSRIIYCKNEEIFHVNWEKNRKLIIFSAGWAKKEFRQAGFSQTDLFFFFGPNDNQGKRNVKGVTS